MVVLRGLATIDGPRDVHHVWDLQLLRRQPPSMPLSRRIIIVSFASCSKVEENCHFMSHRSLASQILTVSIRLSSTQADMSRQITVTG